MSHDNTRSIIDVLILEEQQDLTLDALCQACSTQIDELLELVDEGVIVPDGAAPEVWRFTGVHLRRARIAVHLRRDLGVNPAGAALALQLIEERDELRARLRALGASV